MTITAMNSTPYSTGILLADLEDQLDGLTHQMREGRLHRRAVARYAAEAITAAAAEVAKAETADRLKLARVLADADHCHGMVTRDGEQDACGKPPTTILDAHDVDGGYWPACTFHAYRYGRGRVVPLSRLLASNIL